MNSIDCGEIHNKITSGMKTFFSESGTKRAVLGLSGGVDSALCAKLAGDALGKENVTALLIPEKGVTPEATVTAAEVLAKQLGIEYVRQEINDFLVPFGKLGWAQNKTAQANTKARVRAVLLYNYANSNKALVVGTGNKSEMLLGYFTKFGDAAADLLPIADLWKSEVFELSDYLGLPKEILESAPSAHLWEGQTDEKELGAGYATIDAILKMYFEGGMGEKSIVGKGYGEGLVRGLIKRVNLSEHKRHMPRIVKIGKGK